MIEEGALIEKGETPADAYMRAAADRYSIADVAVYAYTHVAGEAGFDLEAFPAVSSWLRRIERTPRFVNDLEPYPPNAAAGAGKSLYG